MKMRLLAGGIGLASMAAVHAAWFGLALTDAKGGRRLDILDFYNLAATLGEASLVWYLTRRVRLDRMSGASYAMVAWSATAFDFLVTAGLAMATLPLGS